MNNFRIWVPIFTEFVSVRMSGCQLLNVGLYTKGQARYSARQEYVAKRAFLILTNLNDE